MSAPALTVAVLVGPLRHRARRVVDWVAEQDVADRIEMLVVDLAPDAEPLALPPGIDAHTIELPGAPISRGKGEAVRRASAPVVAFVEDHCYPCPGWAGALIEAHRGPWAGVGYRFRNANPDTWVSRAGLVADYGMFLDPPRGEADFLSGNNVSYKREPLLALGDRLDDLLIVDFNVQRTLLERGERLFVEPAALVEHENYNRVADLWRANRAYCRVLAANRARGWPLRRRLFYALAAPIAAPAIKAVRMLRAVAARPRLAPLVVAALPVIVTTYAHSAAGEARGYFDRSAAHAEAEFLVWELATARAEAR